MNPRNTLVLALVVAAVGAFVWFYEIEGAGKRSEAESASKRLFAGVEADAIDGIELESEDAQNVRLERAADEGWQLVAPLAFPADRFAADGIASTLAELEADASFDTPEPLANYGLEGEPRVRFGVGEERSGGRHKRSLLADAIEAVIGAVYLDGGMEAAERVVRPLLERAGGEHAAAADSKTELQELARQANWVQFERSDVGRSNWVERQIAFDADPSGRIIAIASMETVVRDRNRLRRAICQ